MSSFKAKSIIRFRQADPAGITFFGEAYSIAHDALEDYVKHMNLWKEWFGCEEWIAPMRKSSCEHIKPLKVGNEIETEVLIEKMGESSVTFKYRIRNKNEIHFDVELVHVFVSVKTFQKIAIPSQIREKLSAYQAECLRA